MKCYLHIGTEKTATTLLQHFLADNRKYLLETGYAYLKSAGLPNNRRLTVAAFNPDRRDRFTLANHIEDNQSLLELQKDIITEIKRELMSAPVQSVIFSSEHIHSRLTTIDEINRLKSILIHLGIKETRVIVYLRNPVDIAHSLYSTAIKCGSKSKNPHHAKNPKIAHLCNHKKTLENFSSVFGKKNIEVGIFEKDYFHNESIIEDFAKKIKLPWSNTLIIPQEKNKSLSKIGLEQLLKINNSIPLVANNKDTLFREQLINLFEKNFPEQQKKSKKLTEEYEAEYQDSNEWVRKNWFPERKKLFNGIPTPEENNIPTSPIELDQIASFIIDILLIKKP